jgi:hypothetical protein
MTNQPSHLTDAMLEFDAFSPNTIVLDSDAIQQALQCSKSSLNEQRTWQAYINGLALFGFEQWLKQRSIQLEVVRSPCTALNPEAMNLLPGINRLQVGAFTVCLLAVESPLESTLEIARALVDLPELVAHYYFVVEVLEEVEQVNVHAAINYVQLHQHLQSAAVVPQEDWIYEVPLAWFSQKLNPVLLQLTCLAPTAIALPTISINQQQALLQARQELLQILPHLRDPDRPLYQVLSWEQASIVLTQPALLKWIYRLQSGESYQSLVQHLQTTLQLLTQSALNLAVWFQNQVDAIARQDDWVLLPFLAPAILTPTMVGMRSAADDIDLICQQLQQGGMAIPVAARRAYKDLTLANQRLRLYVVTWKLGTSEDTEQSPDWTFLAILSGQPDEKLSEDVRMQISDADTLLAEQFLDKAMSEPRYLYVQVSGRWGEKLLLTLCLNDQELTLPPLGFDLEVGG